MYRYIDRNKTPWYIDFGLVSMNCPRDWLWYLLLAKQEATMAHNQGATNVAKVYEVRVYRYDAAPDGGGYYLRERSRTTDRNAAHLELLYHKQNYEDGCAVWCDGKIVEAFGIIPEISPE